MGSPPVQDPLSNGRACLITCLTDMFIRLNFALLLETEKSGPHLSLGTLRAGLALYLFFRTYYMLITPIPKPRLQEVNLVGHYASLYFRVLRVGSSWG